MSRAVTRRDVLQGLLATSVAMGIDWPALAQGEQMIPFTDVPPPPATARNKPVLLESFFTPNETFYNVAHYPLPPAVDPAAYRLRVSGLVERPIELTLADLKKRARLEQVVGFECGGSNNARGNSLMGNAKWVGTSVAALLKECRPRATAREVVFFSLDEGEEEIIHGGAPVKVKQNFARSLAIEDALRSEVMLAWEMTSPDRPHERGAPVRMIVPGCDGGAMFKWLTQIHLQDSRFVGRFMGRDYVTLRGEDIGGQMRWNESWVSRIRLKSAIARLTRSGSTFKAYGFALTDGTPLRTVEVKVDDGPWKPVVMDKQNTTYSWKLFTYEWSGLTPGDHTIVPRATDANGLVQPLESDLENKKTRWENNGQFVRKFTV